MARHRLPVSLLCGLSILSTSAVAAASPGEPGSFAELVERDEGYHPWYTPSRGGLMVDLSYEARAARAAARAIEAAPLHVPVPAFDQLDEYLAAGAPVPAETPEALRANMPAGWVQVGNLVGPGEVVRGERIIDPTPNGDGTNPTGRPADIYPRKHTMYLNFVGAMLVNGKDNSALNKSVLAGNGFYPAYTGGEQRAIAIAQAIQQDFSQFGVRVLYAERPDPILPYTMQMVGGSWRDTNLDSPAGGVAPGGDCGGLSQRHTVYTFAGGSAGTNSVSGTASQEAAHAWGLDHTLNCGSPMAYCGSGDKAFSPNCDTLCEAQCQGPGSIFCPRQHEEFCAGGGAQNDVAEQSKFFGDNTPDVTPPVVDIMSPVDGQMLNAGDSIALKALVDDDYGGWGWRIIVEQDGQVAFDEIDFEQEYVDAEGLVSLNFNNLPVGVYTITIEALDHADQRTIESVTVGVGEAVPPDPTTSGTTTDSSTSDGSTTDASSTTGTTASDASASGSGTSSTGSGSVTGDTTDASTTVASGTSGGNETDGLPLDATGEDDGCACRADRGAPADGWLGLLSLAALPLLTRRRRAA